VGYTIQFNVTLFRTQFAQFASDVLYPDATLQTYWDMATNYVTNKAPQGLGLCLPQQTLALNLMTAHLAALMTLIASGQSSGVVQGATIDKVSVQLQPPPVVDQWQWWLNQTPYGQQLIALLSVVGVGGFYFGGYPTNYTLAR
jgi:hypothetical protein